MKRIEIETVRLGLGKFYLFTSDMEDFYSTLDWKVIGREIHRKDEVTLMEKVIAA